MPRFSILPAEEGFFEWFEKGGENLVEAARLLVELLKDYTDVQTKVAKITEQEHHGDFIVHEIYDMLHRTFIPPLDRETIRQLAGAIDDVVDNVEAAADLMLLYKVQKPTPQAIRLGEIILDCAQQIEEAMPLLRNKRTILEVRKHTIEINRLENQADTVARAGVAELLDEQPEDCLNLIRWKEIYSALEEATDRCEDVADALNGIVLEQS
jgi:predicted phosphate transport protein (TIGR00153 family)